jgi:hypothetical protein
MIQYGPRERICNPSWSCSHSDSHSDVRWEWRTSVKTISQTIWIPWALFLRRRLGVQASQGSGRPGRLASSRLIRFPLYFSNFLSFFHWYGIALPRLGVLKGADRLTSPCRLKNIAPESVHVFIHLPHSDQDQTSGESWFLVASILSGLGKCLRCENTSL